jgi:hypothetical protein
LHAASVQLSSARCWQFGHYYYLILVVVLFLLFIMEQNDETADLRRMQGNIYALTIVRLFGLFSMIGSGFIIRDIARKLYSRPGAFLQKVSLTQSILIVLSIGDFFG